MWWLGIGWLAACTDAQVTVRNASPSVTFLSPVEGATVAPGVVQARANVSDADDDATELRLAWRLDEAVVCDSAVADANEVACALDVAAGTRRLSLTATDPAGAAGVASVEFAVDGGNPPELTLLQPLDGAVLRVDAPVALEATVADREDPPETLLVRWSSDVDGELWAGVADAGGHVEAAATLSEGRHRLAASVLDSSGNEVVRAVSVDVRPPNQAPSCAITHPADATRAPVGESIAFQADVADVDQDATALQVAWSSDAIGEFARPTPTADGLVTAATSSLPAGAQPVTLAVFDDEGAVCRDTIVVTVVEPPTAEIRTPSSGDVVNEAEIVSFEGVIGDAEDATTALTVRWRSDVDGVLWAFAADSSGATEWSSDALSAGAHTLTLEVTDSDGLRATDSVALTVNAPPTPPSVTIAPATPRTGDDLVAELVLDATDPEGGPVTYRYVWALDGVDAGLTTARVPASATTRGERWSVRVIPSDGRVEGVAGSASVTIGNTPPSLRSASVLPTPLLTLDEADCDVLGAADDDGDAISVQTAWAVNGVAVSDEASYTGFAKGDTVTCTATPFDGLELGVPVAASATVENTAPSAEEAVISPEAPRAGDVVRCDVVGFSDIDGDGDATRFTWTRNGVAVGEGGEFPRSFVGGDLLACTAIPSDGASDGAPVSASVLVGNSAPTATGASVAPEPAYVDDTLSCSILGYADADGDADRSTFEWTIDGASVGTGPTLTGGFSAGDLVTCAAMPSDGADDGAAVSASVEIQNSPPETAVPTLSPTTAYETSTLTCSPGTTTDADGGVSFAYRYAWTVNGVAAGTTATTLDGASFSKGDVVTCAVAASDGAAWSATATASAVTILNSRPSVSVTIVPDPLRTDDTATVGLRTSDADGDAVSVAYAWTVGGASAGSASSLDGRTWFKKGDRVRVSVTPSDGSASGVAVAAEAEVANSPPSAPEIALSPADPVAGDDDLVCEVVTPAVDPDGDALSYQFDWSVDAVARTTALSTVYPGDTVDGAVTTARQTWVCEAYADDGDELGDAGSASVRVLGVPVDYGHLQFPCTTSASVGSTFTAYGWVYHPGVTPGVGRGAGLTVQGGYGPDGAAPTASSWSWTSAAYNGDKDGLISGDRANDEYAVTFTAPAAGAWDFAFRASTDGGLSWLYMDKGGYCGGNGSRDGYATATTGALVTY
jgi:hypothetical protein